MIWLLTRVFGVVAVRQGPDGVVFAMAQRLPNGAGGMAVYPLAMVSLETIKNNINNPGLDFWLVLTWLEEWYHAARQQRPRGPLFYALYALDWVLDLAQRKQPYADSEMENQAKAWVQAVLEGREANPLAAEMPELIRWAKELAQ